MAKSLHVLVTGSAGRIGRAVVRELKERGHFVRGLDLVATPGADESLVSDLADAAAVRRAAEGVEAIIHLAATPDDDDFLTKLLPNNIVGAYHVLEAARLADVRRIVLASSGQVVWHQRFTGPLPIRADVQPTPRGWYAATKIFQEAAGRAFADAHKRSVIAARLGWCPRTKDHAEELAGTGWGQDVYLSPGDAGRFFAQTIEAAADIRFAVVYVCSRPVGEEVYDVAPARELVGYEARDTWPQGIEDLGWERPS
jgi:uronate dehydrogenase